MAALLLFHSFLALANVTTVEMVKAGRLEYLRDTLPCDLPFSQGVAPNLKLFCFDHGWRLMYSEWVPKEWRRPLAIVRDSPEWWNHPWQNKYWSCC